MTNRRPSRLASTSHTSTYQANDYHSIIDICKTKRPKLVCLIADLFCLVAATSKPKQSHDWDEKWRTLQNAIRAIHQLAPVATTKEELYSVRKLFGELHNNNNLILVHILSPS